MKVTIETTVDGTPTSRITTAIEGGDYSDSKPTGDGGLAHYTDVPVVDGRTYTVTATYDGTTKPVEVGPGTDYPWV